jgi:hypothetical protein
MGHETGNDNGIRVVNFASYKILTVKIQNSDIVKFVNLLGRLQMGKSTIR